MIIFDLDGTLADCEHRRHFVDWHKTDYSIPLHKWKPDWKSFYEACDKDEPIEPVLEMFRLISIQYDAVEIWSGRCESVRDKTLNWLIENTKAAIDEKEYFHSILKMRPIGDSIPDDVLKERWLDELIIAQPIGYAYMRHPIDFVFDDSETCCNMWNKRDIMCFLIKDAHGYSKNKISS